MANVKFTISGDNSSAMKAFAQVKGAAGGLADNLNGSLKGAIAGAFGVAAITETIKKTIEYADNIDEASSRLDVGIEKLQEWTFAAKQSGASMEDLVSFSEKLSLLAQTNPSKLTELGINPNQTPEDLMKSVNKRVMEIGLTSEATALLKEIGGKSAGGLLNTFKTDLDEAGAKARAMGAVMDTETTVALAALGDQFSIITQIIASQVGPALLGLAIWAKSIWEKADAGLTWGFTRLLSDNIFTNEQPRENAIDTKREELNQKIFEKKTKALQSGTTYKGGFLKNDDSAIKAGMKEVITDWKEGADDFTAMLKEAADRANQRGKTKITTAADSIKKTKDDTDKSKIQFNDFKNNPMASIGGIAGIDARLRAQIVNEKMLTQLQAIANSTREMNLKMKSNLSLVQEGDFPS